jgi:hypothetical protein
MGVRVDLSGAYYALFTGEMATFRTHVRHFTGTPFKDMTPL